MSRCENCDRPVATVTDYNAHPAACDCDTCRSLCWRHWNPDEACGFEPVDWRVRALAAETELSRIQKDTVIPLRDLYDVLARTFQMPREDVEKRLPLDSDAILVSDLYDVLARAFRTPRDEIKKRLLGACFGK